MHDRECEECEAAFRSMRRPEPKFKVGDPITTTFGASGVVASSPYLGSVNGYIGMTTKHNTDFPVPESMVRHAEPAPDPIPAYGTTDIWGSFWSPDEPAQPTRPTYLVVDIDDTRIMVDSTVADRMQPGREYLVRDNVVVRRDGLRLHGRKLETFPKLSELE